MSTAKTGSIFDIESELDGVAAVYFPIHSHTNTDTHRNAQLEFNTEYTAYTALYATAISIAYITTKIYFTNKIRSPKSV
jgi:hypothetical protein